MHEYEVLRKANLVNYGFVCLVLTSNASITMVRGVDLCMGNGYGKKTSFAKRETRETRPKEPFTRRLRAGFSRRLSCQISIYVDY